MTVERCSFHIEKRAYPQAPSVLWRRQCKRRVRVAEDDHRPPYCHDHMPYDRREGRLNPVHASE